MLSRRQLEQAGRSDEHFIFFLRHPIQATTSFFLGVAAAEPPDLNLDEESKAEVGGMLLRISSDWMTESGGVLFADFEVLLILLECGAGAVCRAGELEAVDDNDECWGACET